MRCYYDHHHRHHPRGNDQPWFGNTTPTTNTDAVVIVKEDGIETAIQLGREASCLPACLARW